MIEDLLTIHKEVAQFEYKYNKIKEMLESCTAENQAFSDINDELRDENAKLKEALETATPILDNLKYWETCPDEYVEKIEHFFNLLKKHDLKEVEG